MPPSESEYKEIPLESGTDTAGAKPIQLKQTNSDIKLGQLEVLVSSLKEKVDNSLELRKWFFVALVTWLGIIVAVIFGVSNIINNSLNSNSEMQKNYYQLLIQD